MNFTPCPSPNYDSRDGHIIDMLVLHYTGMASAAQAIDRLCDPAAKVSAHYVVEEDGKVHRLVDEEHRAWHAGVSFWRGNTNINQRSIGIEIVNPGHEFGYVPFPDAQMQNVVTLCQGIIKRHPIPARNVVGHSDVAPTRKEDPGELFNWKRLAAAGVGLWPAGAGDVNVSAQELCAYGYDVSNMKAAITAFQRHFRPTSHTGIWDEESAMLLAGLLTLL